jgi:hypothetical protein
VKVFFLNGGDRLIYMMSGRDEASRRVAAFIGRTMTGMRRLRSDIVDFIGPRAATVLHACIIRTLD